MKRETNPPPMLQEALHFKYRVYENHHELAKVAAFCDEQWEF